MKPRPRLTRATRLCGLRRSNTVQVDDATKCVVIGTKRKYYGARDVHTISQASTVQHHDEKAKKKNKHSHQTYLRNRKGLLLEPQFGQQSTHNDSELNISETGFCTSSIYGIYSARHRSREGGQQNAWSVTNDGGSKLVTPGKRLRTCF
jgi:hypothetical protein